MPRPATPASRKPSAKRREHAAETLRLLMARYPQAECALLHRNPWELLCATILSAQCTDDRVNMVTPTLFQRYPDATVMAGASQADVEAIIKSTGFFRNKAQSLIAMSQDVVARFGGEVPRALEELTTLRGVGRKTANVVLGVCYGGQAVVVDTHVRRISQLLGWTAEDDPDKIEQDLMALLPRDQWTAAGHTLIQHGRTVCVARRPRCAECPVAERCPSAFGAVPAKA
ncbi:MAG TPA: endonuclease III [Chthonomonadales bacterium]|nr:endonuclease III [Chthonomonadales bacterium]